MTQVLPRVAAILAAAAILAVPSLAASPSIVASVTVTTSSGAIRSAQLREHVIEVGKEVTLYSGPGYRIAALPKEIDTARALIDFKLIPTGPPANQVVPPGSFETSLIVGGSEQTILSIASRIKDSPEIKVLLRRN